jgi:hypothetical protein
MFLIHTVLIYNNYGRKHHVPDRNFIVYMPDDPLSATCMNQCIITLCKPF